MINPKTLSRGLLRMLDILYSKSWSATRGLRYAVLPLKATISPTVELMLKAYGGWTEHRPDIEDTDVRLENGLKGVEEQVVMRVVLLWLFFFGSSP